MAPLVFWAPGVLSCWAGLLCVPVGGGPPASRPRRELRSARRLEARPGPAAAHRHRGRSLRRPPHLWRLVAVCGWMRRLVVRPVLPLPTGTAAMPRRPRGGLHTSGARSLMLLGALACCLPWPCRRPPAPRPGPAGHAVASNRVGLGARVLVLAMLPPSGTAPVSLSAHHAGAASLLIPGSARQDRRLDRSSWSGPERNIAPADCSSAWHASAVKETPPLLS